MARRRRPFGGRNGGQTAAGWLFVSPVIVILTVFMAVPIVMALWVSVSDWTGRGNPFGGGANFVGMANYADLLSGETLASRQLGTALRNNVYYVLLVVPIQTAVSLGLAVLVNRRRLRGRGFFRTAFYFPSVTSSVAITVVFLFLFSASGAVNRTLAALGANGPNWFADPRGLIHIVLGGLGVTSPPEALRAAPLLGVSWWDWLAGPSVAMSVFMIMAIFTTSGTFMLLFVAALQNISAEVEEAALVDGATGWQRLRYVTIPMLRPTIFTVVTLGLIGTWQVFDQIYTGSQGAPANTTMTPAFLSYQMSFIDQRWGNGAAIAFILFAIIVLMTLIQRNVLRERETVPRRKRFYRDGVVPSGAASGEGPAAGPAAGSKEAVR
ncbi:carbohydrate ABC transporter membrane protein 1 (CUT1 family) [Xylanimonas ulmi]|uniref:Carbohydrate ABC transporter membrane protein 1 (CUT1 family) n=1 Tax=Xylanimonas ulmi TaxID=228973 RepID=A0A4Q7LXN4_9MICO|nr:carbohydrate ABC transporter membrane protein 1 (CUT1 family) [Xylanibacterium ulmi]